MRRRHSAAEWAQGNKRTSGGGTYITKMVSQGFPSQAAQVTECLGEAIILSEGLSFLDVVKKPVCNLGSFASLRWSYKKCRSCWNRQVEVCWCTRPRPDGLCRSKC